MPNPPVPDETPAWIKGDLPADDSSAEAPVHQADEAGQAAEPAAPIETAAEAAAAVAAVAESAVAETQAETPVAGDWAPEPASALETPAEPAPEGEDTVEPVAEAEMAAATANDVAAPTLEDEEQVVENAEPAAEGGQPVSAVSAAEGTAAAEAIADAEATAATGLAAASGIETPAAEPPAPAAPVVEELSLEAQVESLLFVADGAVPVARLAEALEVSNRDIEAALTALAESYHQRGLSLQRFRDKVQLTTSPSAAARVERFLGLAAASPLSRAALETLAIVAYQQPVTRPQIEAVRGVNSDSVIKNLLSKGLIEESGRAEGPGRPVLYSTTSEFMQHFGLASLADLPPLTLPSADSLANPERILKG